MPGFEHASVERHAPLRARRSLRLGSGTQHLRSSSAKNYPKGDEEDDEEEGESLWRRGVNQSDEESEMALEESLKGIRLVTQSKE